MALEKFIFSQGIHRHSWKTIIKMKGWWIIKNYIGPQPFYIQEPSFQLYLGCRPPSYTPSTLFFSVDGTKYQI